jgi:putative spermidine/putrescine transport system permease protein
VSTTTQTTVAAGVRPSRAVRRRRALRKFRDVVGLLPFFAYTALFFGGPTVLVVVKAFQDQKNNWTTANVVESVQDVYFDSFVESLKLAFTSAASGTLIGFAAAYALLATGNAWLRRITQTAAGVFANTGGIPLAFMFIAALGTYGLVTELLLKAGIDIYAGSWTLFGFSGLLIVYLYFQIPLMIIVILPALEAQRKEWREAATNLGASTAQYWLHVGGPILFAPVAGAFLLLFANAFAAYATARALTSGTIPLVPLQIGSLLSGNVIADRANLGFALGFGMIVIVAIAMSVYNATQKRAAKWLQ